MKSNFTQKQIKGLVSQGGGRLSNGFADLKDPYLADHGLCVDLTHVVAGVVALHLPAPTPNSHILAPYSKSLTKTTHVVVGVDALHLPAPTPHSHFLA